MRMLVTRPAPEASETMGRLIALGIDPGALPLLERRTLSGSLPDAAGFAAIAFTSTNAIEALHERGALQRYVGLPVFAVGSKTAEAAFRAGFRSVEVGAGGLAGLVERVEAAKLTGPVFYPAARDQAGDLAKALAPSGIMVVTSRVYEMDDAASLDPEVLDHLGAGAFGAALFYSRRTAAAFVRRIAPLLPPASRTTLGMLCLSEAVAEPLVGARFVRIGLADHPSEEAMMSLALSFARDQNAS